MDAKSGPPYTKPRSDQGRQRDSLAAGYIRVSTEEQGISGLGLAAQTDSITTAADRRGLTLLDPLHVDVASGKSRAHRPGLEAALDDVSTGRAGTLVVAKLDRLARSVLDFCTIVAQAEHEKWNLVVLDPPVDLADPSSRLLAHIMASFAEWERNIISQRTHEAMQAAKRRGAIFGRPLTVGSDVHRTIVEKRAEGMSYRAIANLFNDLGVPTGQGGLKWYPATVQKIEHRSR